jgi:hypothetical protein
LELREVDEFEKLEQIHLLDSIILMALVLPVDNTQFQTFAPGDSIIKSETRLPAYFETAQLLHSAILEYNQENPTVPYPVSALSFNDDDSTATFSIQIPYLISAAGKKARDYIKDATTWVVPTTGEMVGIESLLDAFEYQTRILSYVNDKLRANVIINSPQGLITYDDNYTNAEWAIGFTLPYNAVVNATGQLLKTAINYPVFLDMQEGL